MSKTRTRLKVAALSLAFFALLLVGIDAAKYPHFSTETAYFLGFACILAVFTIAFIIFLDARNAELDPAFNQVH